MKILFISLVLVFLAGCSMHKYELRPNLQYLEHDSMGFLVCRVDASGGRICDRDLSYFENKRVYLVPENGWVKK